MAVEIHLDPKQFFGVVHQLHCFVVVAASSSPTALTDFLLLIFPSLTTSYVDLNISLLISSITSSNCSNGWLFVSSLLCCTYVFSMDRSARSPLLSLSLFVVLSGHSAANSNSTVPLPSDRFASARSSSSCSPDWYVPLSSSNLAYWMCKFSTITLLTRASNSSHRPTKSMMFVFLFFFFFFFFFCSF
jgi:hypothetical protein